MVDSVDSVSVVALTAAVGAVILLFIIFCGIADRRVKDTEDKNDDDSNKTSENKSKPQQHSKKEKFSVKPKRDISKTLFTHSWLAGSLKGHSGQVLDVDFSPNAKYLVTCADDRTMLFWNVKEFNQKEKKSVRANVELDHATQVKFSPDSKAVVTCLFNGNAVRVIKIGKKADGGLGNFQEAVEFPIQHAAEIIALGISSTGKFIMTCSRDTTIKIWDLKGELLSTLDTHQVNNSHGAVSPCGRFVGSSGFTPDVKVWEVCFSKDGTFKEVCRAFELKGHKAGVYSFCFSSDSHRMATVSKDGTWKLWNTNVQYQMQQDPYLLVTGQYSHMGPSLVALSPDISTVAVASKNDISIFHASSAEHDITIENAHAAPVKGLVFDSSSKYLVSIGNKHTHIFHNITSYRVIIEELQEKKQKATSSAMRERLQQQADEARISLKTILNAESQ